MRSVRTPAPHTYPALRCALLFIAGVLCGPLPGAAALFAALTALSFLFCLRTMPWRFSPGLFLSRVVVPSLLVAGLGAMRISADRASVPAIADSLTAGPLTVAGTVATFPGGERGRVRFLLHAEAWYNGQKRTPLGADLAVTLTGIDVDSLPYSILPGMPVALHGVLSLPGPSRNPGEISLAAYLAANSIAATFFVRGRENLRIIHPAGGSWPIRALVTPVRSAIERIADGTIGGEEGAFLKGLLLGERGDLSRETMEAFVTAGVAHVLAVSGSNVAVVALMLGFFAALVRLARPVRMGFIAAGLVFYMELTGGQTPVVRATIMALVFMIGKAVQRRANGYNSLGLSAIIILASDAGQLFDPGFQLSFSAVFGIIHFYPRMNAWIGRFRRAHRWQRTLVPMLRLSAVSLAATLGTVPVTASWFGRISLIGILANIPVVPATGLSVVLGAAAVTGSAAGSWIASALGALNAVLLQATLTTARLAAAVPFASLDASRFSAFAAIAFYAGAGLVFHWHEPGGVRLFLPVLLLSLNIIVFFPAEGGPGSTPGFLHVHVIDVGQGDAILVEIPGGRTILIDAGPASPGFDAGEKTVLPYLRRRGITRIDLLVVTHPHSDHLGGAPALLRHMEIGRLVDSGQPVRSSLYGSYRRIAVRDGTLPGAVSGGTVLDAGPEARLYVLSPLPRFVDQDTLRRPPNLNNVSVVLKLLYGAVSMLFVGDAEEEAEASMAAQYGDFLRSAVLKSGHHGSITSSSEPFLDAVRPALVAVSVGRRNRFHHPSQVVLQRYASRGALVARTDMEGAIILETDGRIVRRVEWR